MYNFAIRQAYNSEKLLVEFVPDPGDRVFQVALYDALTPLGFSVTCNEHGVWASHPDPGSDWAAVRIDSDAWCTFGEADLWSGNVVRNHELTARLGAELMVSGKFQQVPWHGERQPGD
jgi:hypothetical protein